MRKYKKYHIKVPNTNCHYPIHTLPNTKLTNNQTGHNKQLQENGIQSGLRNTILIRKTIQQNATHQTKQHKKTEGFADLANLFFYGM